MSRIAGIHRPAAPRAAEAEATVRRMLDRYEGKVDLLSGPHGALGRIARPGQGAGSDICETSASIVVLDGRILNAAELRAALPSARPGDAALIAALVDRHGMPTALKHLSGDFALAVLDRAAGRLWLARDRFGVQAALLDAGRRRRGVRFPAAVAADAAGGRDRARSELCRPVRCLALPHVRQRPRSVALSRHPAASGGLCAGDRPARPRLAGALLATRGSG